jgi:hypothetical protein
MANVGVRVERFVRLRRVGRVWQVHTDCVRFKCLQNFGYYLAKRILRQMTPLEFVVWSSRNLLCI